jgi:WD40 repeat protein
MSFPLPEPGPRRTALDLPTAPATTLKGHTGPVLAVRFNSDGNYCLTCGQDRIIKLWNPAKGLCVKSYVGHGHEVFDVGVSSDNSRIASCGGDKVVFYWDVASGNTIRKFKGHDLKVNAVLFAGEDSSVVISGSYDKTVRIFDCRSRSFEAMQVAPAPLLRRSKDVLSVCACAEWLGTRQRCLRGARLVPRWLCANIEIDCIRVLRR